MTASVCGDGVTRQPRVGSDQSGRPPPSPGKEIYTQLQLCCKDLTETCIKLEQLEHLGSEDTPIPTTPHPPPPPPRLPILLSHSDPKSKENKF